MIEPMDKQQYTPNDNDEWVIEVPDNTSSKEKRKQQKEAKSSGIKSFIITLVVAIAIGLFLKFFVISFVDVQGSSMIPTLHTGDKLLIEKVVYRFALPSRGDVIVCTYDNYPDVYVKRVIGLPGDTLEIKDGYLHINGEMVEEPYLDPSVYPLENYGPVTIEEGHVFVMGDNRGRSLDSTSSSVGQISLDNIIGCARLKVWPLSEFGGL